MNKVNQATINLIATLHWSRSPKPRIVAFQALGDEGYTYVPKVYQGLLKRYWLLDQDNLTEQEYAYLEDILTKLTTTQGNPTPAQVQTWCDIIRSGYNERQLEYTLDEGQRDYNQGKPVEEIIGTVVSDLLALQAPASTTLTGESLANSAKAEVQLIRDGRSHEVRIPYHLEPLQRKTGGIPRKRFAMVAAARSHGKSALCDEMVFHDALRIVGQGLKACNVIISGENTKEDVIKDQAARFKNLCLSELENHDTNPVWTDLEFDRLNEGIDKAAGLPVVINDRRGLGIDNIRATLQTARAQYGDIRILMIDTLERVIPARNHRAGDKEHKYLIAGIEQLCDEFNCAGLILHHLNREFYNLTDPRKINDGFIRWGGETEAWQVIIPYIPEKMIDQLSQAVLGRYGYNSDMDKVEFGQVAEIRITKNKGNLAPRLVNFEEVYFEGRTKSWKTK